MASLGGNILPLNMNIQTILAGVAFAAVGSVCFSRLFANSGSDSNEPPSVLKSFLLFFYSCFIKPHEGNKKGNQQDALESFYKKQAGAYDATRKILLQGREDMLALAAAQLQAKAQALKEAKASRKIQKRIWVDVRIARFPVPRPY
jgi:betaine lipid synthase